MAELHGLPASPGLAAGGAVVLDAPTTAEAIVPLAERPARRSADPHSGPLAPPTVDTSVLPQVMRTWPGGSSPRPASAFSTASKPRTMLVP